MFEGNKVKENNDGTSRNSSLCPAATLLLGQTCRCNIYINVTRCELIRITRYVLSQAQTRCCSSRYYHCALVARGNCNFRPLISDGLRTSVSVFPSTATASASVRHPFPSSIPPSPCTWMAGKSSRMPFAAISAKHAARSFHPLLPCRLCRWVICAVRSAVWQNKSLLRERLTHARHYLLVAPSRLVKERRLSRRCGRGRQKVPLAFLSYPAHHFYPVVKTFSRAHANIPTYPEWFRNLSCFRFSARILVKSLTKTE